MIDLQVARGVAEWKEKENSRQSESSRICQRFKEMPRNCLNIVNCLFQSQSIAGYIRQSRRLESNRLNVPVTVKARARPIEPIEHRDIRLPNVTVTFVHAKKRALENRPTSSRI